MKFKDKWGITGALTSQIDELLYKRRIKNGELKIKYVVLVNYKNECRIDLGECYLYNLAN